MGGILNKGKIPVDPRIDVTEMYIPLNTLLYKGDEIVINQNEDLQE